MCGLATDEIYPLARLPDLMSGRQIHPLLDDGFPGGHSGVAPPDPIPNSEVKRSSADDSVGLPHVKVGHRQVLSLNPRHNGEGFFNESGKCGAFGSVGKVVDAAFSACIIRASLKAVRGCAAGLFEGFWLTG